MNHYVAKLYFIFFHTLTGVRLMHISRESVSLRGKRQHHGSAVKYDGCNKLQWLASEVMHMQKTIRICKWADIGQPLSVKALLRSSRWIRNCYLWSTRQTPAPISWHGHMSFWPVPPSTSYSSPWNTNLSIPLSLNTMEFVSFIELIHHHRAVWWTYIKDSMDLGFIKMAMG